MEKFNLKKYLTEGKLLKENTDFPELEDEFEGAMGAMIVEPKVYLKNILKASAEEIVSDNYYEVMNAVEQGFYSKDEAVKLAKAWAKEKLSTLDEGKLNEGYNSSTVMAVRKLLTDDFIGNIENSAEIKIQDKGFDMLDNFFLDFISKHKESIAEGSVKGIGLKESLQQLTPEEKNLLKDILEEKVESYEFGIDRYEVFIKDPNSKIHKDEIEEMKNNSEIVKNILNRL